MTMAPIPNPPPKLSTGQKATGVTAVIGAAVLLATPLVARWEGTINVGYRDPINIATACTGHTGWEVIVGKRYSKAECDAFLDADLNIAARDVRKCITVDLTPKTYAALISFTFNVGGGALCKSTLARKFNTGDYWGGCAQLSKWTYAGGKQWKGLVRRRADERQLCEAGLLR